MDVHATIIPIPLDQLTISEHNARTIDRKPLDDLAASIAAEGLLQNLTVIAGQGDTYHVIAGKRRYGALKLLRERGELPPELEAPPCRIVDDARAISASLAENVVREAMHPADEFEAFQRLAAAGRGTEEIAQEFGVAPIVVQRRLRLANVAPSLFAQFRDDKISLDQMMALAVTDDHEAQEAAWNDAPEYARSPFQLRQRLTAREISILADRAARFVGIDAIVAAGGTVREDLFVEGGGYTSDRALIDRLAREKLESHVDAIKAEGWAWVEARPDWNVYSADNDLRYGAYPIPEQLAFRSQADADEHARATQRLAELQELAGEDDLDDEQAQEYGELEDLTNEIEARSGVWDPEDLARTGAVITIGDDGRVEIERGLVRLRDLPSAASDVDADSGDPAPASTAKPAKAKLSQAMIARLAAHRTAALQDAVADFPSVARAVLAYALLKSLAAQYSELSAIKLADRTHALTTAAPDLADAKHHAQIQADIKALRKRIPKAADLLPWCLELTPTDLDQILTLCVAASITTGPAERAPADAQQLMSALDLDLADYWQPTAAGYFDHVPATLVLDAVAEACGKDAVKGLAGKKKRDLAQAAEQLTAGKRWLPKMLRAAPARKRKG